jgi:hypothetical protein
MAITPEQARALTPDDCNRIKQLETSIDSQLTQRYDGVSFTFQFSTDPPLKERVAKELERLYRASNWQVELKRHASNGTPLAIILSEPKTVAGVKVPAPGEQTRFDHKDPLEGAERPKQS